MDDSESANPEAEEYAHPLSILRRNLETRLGHGFLGRGKSKVDEAPHLAGFLLVHKVQRVKVLDFRGEGDRKAGGIEAMNRPHATRSEEHTSELQSLRHLVCRLLL